MTRTVVIAVLDSLRYDIFRRYVDGDDGAGFLSQLVGSSLDFTGATATAPWSLPSHASIFTGKYPREHGALRFNTRIREELPTLVEQLNDEGFLTACYTSNKFVQSDYGFGPWDRFSGHYGHARFPNAHSPISDESGVRKIPDALSQVASSDRPARSLVNGIYGQARRSPALVDDGGRLMTEDIVEFLHGIPSGDELFLFCNYMETHVYHKQLSSVRRRLWNVRNQNRLNELQSALRNKRLDPTDATLDGATTELFHRLVTDELRYLDRHLERLCDALESVGRDEEMLFILCSDHGDGLGERGFVYHDFGGITEPIVRVPLIVASPETGDETIRKRASLSWIYSTVLNFADEHDGPDLRDPTTFLDRVATENTGHVLDVVDSPEAVHDYYLKDRVAVYDDDRERKYERTDGDHSVYRIEENGLGESRVGTGGRERIEAFERRHESVVGTKFELSESTEQRLRDLGYI
jgi:arylsulfatase A-like enzyme